MIKISELQAKDVVSLTDGKRLGQVCDLEIDMENGMIRAIIVPGGGRFLGMFGNTQDIVVPWSAIIKIGADVILVDLRSDPNYLPPNSGSSSGGY
ncbi:YlmC/YmxH family sporulation protein [Tumebacillus algifaecis]|uniref:YlmC/YmxH family sporulation protein n=1 Tax=Tumebacillus algifaecis TaxID=1214604 RepID=A0A223D323_9BACL|nr:YlmC/YmxH family sporulation protein [Tumebacillus algifaecis]ASS75843.1 YlmC/YmxH family sporulation protein [Tumebacillus algifaecis]